MVMELLTQEMVDAGRELAQRLDQKKLPISAAFWLYFAEPDVWRLVIASVLVKESGPRKAYQLIQSELEATPETNQVISLSNISAVEPNNPLVSPLRALKKIKSIGTSEFKLSRSGVNGHFVEGAYIYKLT